MYSMQVKGFVSLPGETPEQNLEETSVRLEVWQNDALIDELAAVPNPDGLFTFSFTVNPHASVGDFLPTLEPACILCHYSANHSLPVGRVQLRFSASHPQGGTANAVRNIFVDRSFMAQLEVRVVKAEDPQQAVKNVPVRASARMYRWRGRGFQGETDAQGSARFSVECLSQMPTHYIVRVDPVVVDGVRYASTSYAEVTFEPGGPSPAPVTLQVTSELGSVQGRLAAPSSAGGGNTLVRLVHLPDGSSIETQSTEQGDFTFRDVPIDEYLLLAGPSPLEQGALVHSPALVDLTRAIHVQINLAVEQSGGAGLTGTAHTGDLTLPFAWVRLEENQAAQAIDPNSGRFALPNLQPGSDTLLVVAPGYYSRAVLVEIPEAGFSDAGITLKRQEGTQSIPWGTGEILIPAESTVDRGPNLVLERGWLFGAGEGERVLSVPSIGVQIQLQQGRFGLEYLPGESAWFFLFEGQAEITKSGEADPLRLQGGQMVNLAENGALLPAPYDPLVVSALRDVHRRELTPAWEPTITARLRDGFARLGIGMAQIMTFLAYLSILLALAAIPLLALYRRRHQPANG